MMFLKLFFFCSLDLTNVLILYFAANETSTNAEESSEDHIAGASSSNGEIEILIEENPVKTPLSPINDLRDDQGDASVDGENQSPNVQHKRPADPITVEKRKRRATNDMKFQSFQINWSKVSDRLMQQLDLFQSACNISPKQPVPREKRVTNEDLNELVAVVVDQLRTIDKAVSAGIMDTVAKQITARYPCLDFSDDDGFKDGKGFVAIKLKLIHRNSYKNRFKEEGEATQSRSQKAKLRHVQSGTLQEYWQTTSQDCPTSVKSVLQRDEPDQLTNDFLIESQPYVRFLFDNEELDELLSRFSVLRRTVLLNYHFEKATGVNISDLSKYFLAKKRKIIDYSRKSKKQTLGEEASTLEILDFLAHLVNEKLENLIIQKEVIGYYHLIVSFLTIISIFRWAQTFRRSKQT